MEWSEEKVNPSLVLQKEKQLKEEEKTRKGFQHQPMTLLSILLVQYYQFARLTLDGHGNKSFHLSA